MRQPCLHVADDSSDPRPGTHQRPPSPEAAQVLRVAVDRTALLWSSIITETALCYRHWVFQGYSQVLILRTLLKPVLRVNSFFFPLQPSIDAAFLSSDFQGPTLPE